MVKLLIYLIVAFNFTWANSSFECAPQIAINWQTIDKGVEFTQYDLSFTPYDKPTQTWTSQLSRTVTIRALRIDLNEVNLQFHRRDKMLACDPNSERMIQKLVSNQNKNAIAAINSNFYVMNDGDILGIAIDQEKIWSENFNNLSISSNGIMLINKDETNLIKKNELVEILQNKSFKDLQKENQIILQAYPRLLDQNQLQVSDRVKEIRNSRTSIGVELNTNKILIVTIDAGGQNSKTGMSLYEYAHMLQSSDCGVAQNLALNLDGGGSTAIAVPSLNLYKQADRCRNLGNILTILPKK